MKFVKITEKDSHYDALETKSIKELLTGIHHQDQVAVKAVGLVLDKIENLISKLVSQLRKGGRLFYTGAGTSGRLGVLDASECPPTFGTNPKMVKGLIAGGVDALHQSIENAEDDYLQGWRDLQDNEVNQNDFVIGIAASGTTPYVVGSLEKCKENGILTGCITCNLNSPIAQFSDFPIEVIVGPEFVTGSSRMKAGTAQKLILNMITTSSMIQLGRIKGNKMVDMKLSNNKLVGRAELIVMSELQVPLVTAKTLLQKHKNVRKAINAYKR